MSALSRVFMALGAVFAALSVALSAASAHVPALQQAGAAFTASLDQQQFHAMGLVLLGLGWNLGFVGASSLVLECHRPEEKTRVQSLNDFLVFGTTATSSFFAGFLQESGAGDSAEKAIARIRRVSGHFRTGIETMIREAELEEMEKQWREQNARIMAQHPPGSAETALVGTDPGTGTATPVEPAAPPPAEQR